MRKLQRQNSSSVATAVLAGDDLGGVSGGGFLDRNESNEIHDYSQRFNQESSNNETTIDSNNQTTYKFHYDDSFNRYDGPSRNHNSPVIIGSTANNSITVNYK